MTRHALIIDPDSGLAAHLALLAQEAGWDVTAYHSFPDARMALGASPPGLLVTNVRLGLFNGIQLAYLAKLANPSTVVVIYGQTHDVTLAREAQEAGAFFERTSAVAFALPSYFNASLPGRDRRDPTRPERRSVFRGGRRATDIALLHPQPSARWAPSRP